MGIEAGTRVGKYEIKELLGAGGMGEVYRAFDVELKRAAAVKFLSADIATDPKRMRRFEQEALAASALNHPNILTVYDIGQTEGGRPFFATELVEGVTLREHMEARPLKPGEVLDIAAQVASALVAAHAEGIVHRDIKPDNIMVRRDGYVKVLDFGLAKIAGRPTGSADSEAATRALVVTDSGAVMGTVSYMSPEQTAGGEVDARTDIWSLGVVLYEMLTGRVPFRGKSASHTIVSILDDEPPPLAAHLPDAPESLQDIVSEALTKDREARMQTAKQMLSRLQRIRRRLDAGVSLDHSVPPNAIHESLPGGDGAAAWGRGPAHTTLPPRHTTARSDDLLRATAVGVGAHRTEPPAARRGRLALYAALCAAALAAVSFGLYKLSPRWRQTAAAPFAPLGSMKMTKVPATGATVTAVVSPDGKYVARVVLEGGRVSLRLRQIATTGERDLVPADETTQFVGAPTFSRDGAYVYYVAGRRGQLFRELFRVPLVGGEPQKLVYDVDSGVTLSPDGRRVAFRRHVPKTREDTLVVADAEGGGERTVASYKLPERIDAPAWSPDGSVVAYTVSGTDDDGYYVNIQAAPAAGGEVRKVSAARWRSIGNVMAWLADSSGLVFAARDRESLPSTPTQLWYVSYPEGSAQKITNDLNYYSSASLTADSRTLLAKQGRDTANVWVAPGADASRARQLTTGGGDGFSGGSWLPDGRLLYDSDASGSTDVWVMNADGTGKRQLTNDPNTDSAPVASPDGRYVVFRSNRTVGWGIWRMSPDGTNQKELVRNVDNTQGQTQVSPDSRWVYYVSRGEAGRPAVWRVPLEGGDPSKVLEEKVGFVRLSPDGRRLFSIHVESEPGARQKLYVFPAEGGAAVREVTDLPEAMSWPDWSPDGQALDYLDTREGVSNLWRWPLAGGRPRQLTDWKSDFIYRYWWTPDGRALTVARGNSATEIILIQNFR